MFLLCRKLIRANKPTIRRAKRKSKARKHSPCFRICASRPKMGWSLCILRGTMARWLCLRILLKINDFCINTYLFVKTWKICALSIIILLVTFITLFLLPFLNFLPDHNSYNLPTYHIIQKHSNILPDFPLLPLDREPASILQCQQSEQFPIFLFLANMQYLYH